MGLGRIFSQLGDNFRRCLKRGGGTPDVSEGGAHRVHRIKITIPSTRLRAMRRTPRAPYRLNRLKGLITFLSRVAKKKKKKKKRRRRKKKKKKEVEGDLISPRAAQRACTS